MNGMQTVLGALGGAVLFERLRVPAGEFLGAAVVVAVLNVRGSAVELPGSVRFLALVALGWAIGQGVTAETLVQVRRAVVPLFVIVVALMLFAGLVAAATVRLGWMDPTTAFLAASPGAITQMSALATTLEANAALVAVAHTVRVIAVVVVSPFVARLLSG